jgi:membrane-bound inhibitor of C-type lysozyme
MKNIFLTSTLFVLSGCGSVDLWPFGAREVERSSAPANATEYRCDAGKRFYLRSARDGASAWVIFPEREFRLDKVASASGARYTNGSATLETNGDAASFNDGPQLVFTGCRVAGSEKK